MSRVRNGLGLVGALAMLLACGGEVAEEKAVPVTQLDNSAPTVSFKTGDEELGGATGTPGGPYRVSYRIVGTPVVNSPVILDLTVESLLGSRPVTLDYHIMDASSMILGESQLDSVHMEPAANETKFQQQVTVIPQREGRFYLNVSASFETPDGTMSTVTAIPIQVGSGSRELQPNGRVELDENGEAVRVLENDS